MVRLIFTFTLLVFLFPIVAFSSSVKDTIPKGKYKLSREEFLTTYGTDDTSKAIIKYYFKKRNTAATYLVLGGVGIALEIALTSKLASMNYDDDGYDELGMTYVWLLYTGIFFPPSVVASVSGVHKSYKFSKKKLYIDLMNYQNGKGISPKYRRYVIKNKKYWK